MRLGTVLPSTARQNAHLRVRHEYSSCNRPVGAEVAAGWAPPCRFKVLETVTVARAIYYFTVAQANSASERARVKASCLYAGVTVPK